MEELIIQWRLSRGITYVVRTCPASGRPHLLALSIIASMAKARSAFFARLAG